MTSYSSRTNIYSLFAVFSIPSWQPNWSHFTLHQAHQAQVQPSMYYSTIAFGLLLAGAVANPLGTSPLSLCHLLWSPLIQSFRLQAWNWPITSLEPREHKGCLLLVRHGPFLRWKMPRRMEDREVGRFWRRIKMRYRNQKILLPYFQSRQLLLVWHCAPLRGRMQTTGRIHGFLG